MELKALTALETRLNAGLWSKSVCGDCPTDQVASALRLPARPRTPSSRMKLAPMPSGYLEASLSKGAENHGYLAAAVPAMQQDCPSISADLATSKQHGGHLGTLRAMRRSKPVADWLTVLEDGRVPSTAKHSKAAGARDHHSRGAHQPTFRVRRVPCSDRLPQDGLTRTSSYSSISVRTATVSENVGVLLPPPAATLLRCDSMPTIGTAKANDKAVKQVKAKVIAAMQRLFLEEMAKPGQDANGAAADALLRLSQSTSADVADA